MPLLLKVSGTTKTLRFPNYCPCCGKSLGPLDGFEIAIFLGMSGTVSYSVKAPHCRRCADHVSTSHGERLNSVLLLGTKTQTGTVYGLGSDCVSCEASLQSQGTTIGGKFKLKVERAEYANSLIELNPGSISRL